MAGQDDTSVQIAALLVIVAALARKTGLEPDEVIKLGEQATKSVGEPRRSAITATIAGMVSRYRAMP